MKYEFASDLQSKAEEISKIMFPHIKTERIKCFRSTGSSSRGTIARCHALGKIMQKTIGVDAHYALEFLTERFDKLNEEDKIKVMMHELMHIPKTFGGGFKHHDFVCERNVNLYYREYKKRTNTDDRTSSAQIKIHRRSESPTDKENFHNERKNNLIFWK